MRTVWFPMSHEPVRIGDPEGEVSVFGEGVGIFGQKKTRQQKQRIHLPMRV